MRTLRLLPVLLAASTLPAIAIAQMPGAPVLQNAFANRGATVALNVATGKEASLLAAALGFAPGSGRFQFSAGVGRLSPDSGDGRVAFGLRLGVPVFSFASGRIGVAPFVGVGNARRDTSSSWRVPAGVGVGGRMALGATRALSAYATGTYLYLSESEGGARTSDQTVRIALAGDVTLFRNLGLTLGYEGGGEAGSAIAGVAGSIFGVGLSYALR